MSIIFAYMTWTYFLVFSVSSVFLVTFLMSFQLFKIIGWIATQDGNFSQIMVTSGSFFVASLPLALPLALFFSSLYCAGRWSASSEYTAMRSLGMNLKKSLYPILSVALIAAGILFVCHIELIPAGRAYGRKIVAEIQSKALLAEIRSGNFFTQIPNIVFFAENVDPSTFRMDNVFIYQQDDGQKEKIIFAAKGHLIVPESDSKITTHFKLWNGDMIFRENTSVSTDKMSFQQMDYALPPFDYYFDASYKPGFLSYSRLLKLQNEGQRLFDRKEIDFERLVDIKSEVLERIWQSVLCFFFAIIGFMSGLGHFRQNNKGRSFFAFIVLVTYFFVFFFSSGLAKKGIISYYAPYAISFVVLALIVHYLMKRCRWVLGT